MAAAPAAASLGALAEASPEALPEQPFQGHTWTALSRCAAGRGGRAGGVLDGWSLFSEPFRAGETVALELKSNLKHCHAEILGDVLGPEAGERSGQHPVRLLDGDAVVHRQPRKMARVLPGDDLRVLIMADTTTYRRMAKTQVGKEDAVLEIGSAFGDCTRTLACHAKAVVGVDVSQELVEECRRRHLQLRFEWLDCFEEPDRLLSLWEELCGLGHLKIFVDVGGDRAACDVCKVLAALGAVAARSSTRQPALIVVKSEELAAAAGATDSVACTELGEILDVAAWWATVAAPPPPRSLVQEKRKRSRAMKAFWSESRSADAVAQAAAHVTRQERWTAVKAKAEQFCASRSMTSRGELFRAWRRHTLSDSSPSCGIGAPKLLPLAVSAASARLLVAAAAAVTALSLCAALLLRRPSAGRGGRPAAALGA